VAPAAGSAVAVSADAWPRSPAESGQRALSLNIRRCCSSAAALFKFAGVQYTRRARTLICAVCKAAHMCSMQGRSYVQFARPRICAVYKAGHMCSLQGRSYVQYTRPRICAVYKAAQGKQGRSYARICTFIKTNFEQKATVPPTTVGIIDQSNVLLRFILDFHF
jgi:hypothetical protein